MDEKRKVSLPGQVLGILRKDCEDLKFTKADGRPNFNAFINTLIANFYESYAAAEEKLYDDVRAALKDVPSFYREKAFAEVIKVVAGRSDDGVPRGSTVTFSFKPTGVSEKAVTYLENVALKDGSLSSFYRRMFTAYTRKPKNERETIVYAEQYALLQRAAVRGMTACIALKNGDVLKDVSVYSVSPAKDELFNYVLAYTGKRNVTLRLASVKSVSLLSGRSDIPEENALLFKRQVACGAQYPMYNTDREPIKVRLTDKGKELFGKIYLYRPTPVGIEGDVYTFDCSANQLLYYFERFGDRALILSPKKLGIFMRNYHLHL